MYLFNSLEFIVKKLTRVMGLGPTNESGYRTLMSFISLEHEQVLEKGLKNTDVMCYMLNLCVFTCLFYPVIWVCHPIAHG